MRLPGPLLEKASTIICVCLYPVQELPGDAWLATDSGGRQLYVAGYGSDDAVFVRREKRNATVEDYGAHNER